jgi:hypothetical protein
MRMFIFQRASEGPRKSGCGWPQLSDAELM